AISAAASSPPRKMRTPGPISPASIENCTRKIPPSASASPPIHTTQLAPKRSSKLLVGGAGSGDEGGEAVGTPWFAASARFSAGAAPAAGEGANGCSVAGGVSDEA